MQHPRRSESASTPRHRYLRCPPRSDPPRRPQAALRSAPRAPPRRPPSSPHPPRRAPRAARPPPATWAGRVEAHAPMTRDEGGARGRRCGRRAARRREVRRASPWLQHVVVASRLRWSRCGAAARELAHWYVCVAGGGRSGGRLGKGTARAQVADPSRALYINCAEFTPKRGPQTERPSTRDSVSLPGIVRVRWQRQGAGGMASGVAARARAFPPCSSEARPRGCLRRRRPRAAHSGLAAQPAPSRDLYAFCDAALGARGSTVAHAGRRRASHVCAAKKRKGRNKVRARRRALTSDVPTMPAAHQRRSTGAWDRAQAKAAAGFAVSPLVPKSRNILWWASLSAASVTHLRVGHAPGWELFGFMTHQRGRGSKANTLSCVPGCQGVEIGSVREAARAGSSLFAASARVVSFRCSR